MKEIVLFVPCCMTTIWVRREQDGKGVILRLQTGMEWRMVHSTITYVFRIKRIQPIQVEGHSTKMVIIEHDQPENPKFAFAFDF